MDKLGRCPHCNANWNGGDMLEALRKMSIHGLKDNKEIEKLANEYGWTKENPTEFSKVTVTETKLPLVTFTFYECPECNHAFDVQTSKEYDNLTKAKQSILYEEEGETLPEEEEDEDGYQTTAKSEGGVP